MAKKKAVATLKEGAPCRWCDGKYREVVKRPAGPTVTPTRFPESHSPFPGCGGMPRAIGSERTSRLNRMKDAMVRGFMPTCTARKAIRATPLTGTAGRAEPSARSH
jgi:hypothetical protein